jgi:hypothetical protein
MVRNKRRQTHETKAFRGTLRGLAGGTGSLGNFVAGSLIPPYARAQTALPRRSLRSSSCSLFRFCGNVLVDLGR